MAIDKTINYDDTDMAPDMEPTDAVMMPDAMMAIEMDPDESLTIDLDDGGVEVTLIDEPEENELASAPFDANLAEYMDESDLMLIAGELREDIDSDMRSREEWAETYVKGLEILGFKYDERTTPWEGACGVHSTVLGEAAVRFQAETMSETFPPAGPVKTKIIGTEDKEKTEASERVVADMNYKLTEEMTEYRHEHERMLFALGLAGSAFKKVYYDPTLGRQVATYIPAEDIIVPYGASTIEMSERVTHVMRKTKLEVAKLQAAGFYLDVDLPDPEPYHSDIEEKKAEEGGYELTDDDRHTLYEVHINMVIDGLPECEEGIGCPLVITLDRSSENILSIRRNYREDDKLKLKRQHFVHYCYVPGFGFYGLGLIHLVGGFAKAGTSLIRQLVDSGTLANLQGGFKTRGMRVSSDDRPIEPGEWKDVDVGSGSIRDNIMPLPYKEPSQTLFNLLGTITQEGRRMGAISDMNISDMSANAPVGTTLAIIERILKPMAAVQSRVHYAMKQEFKLMKAIIAKNAPDSLEYSTDMGQFYATKADYKLIDIIPVSDPNNTTMAQRVVQYQTVLQMSAQAPEIYDLPQLHRQMIEVLGVKEAEKLVPLKEDATPKDPVSENMDALIGTPMQAFIYQDHEAHIAAHTAFLQDPAMMQMIGQNPQAQSIMAALQAHIAEHLAFSYRNKIEERMGVPLPAPGEELPQGIEIEISRMMAQAGQQLTQQNQQQAAQQQAQQQQQNPEFQLKQQEVQIKAQEQQRKMQKDQADSELKARQQAHKEQMDTIDAALKAKGIKLERQELELEAEKAGANLAAQRRRDGNKLDMDIARMIEQNVNKRRDEARQDAQAAQQPEGNSGNNIPNS